MKIIISAHYSSIPIINAILTEHLRQWLTAGSFEFKECIGCYKGVEEASFIVTFDYRTKFSQLLERAANLQQESVLVMHDDFTACRLHYVSDGSQQDLGDFKEVSAAHANECEAFTFVNGSYYVCQ